MSSFSISISENIDEAAEKAISDGLDRFNEAAAGPESSRSVWVVARDDTGSVIGGLKALSIWTWFMIDWLWVSEQARGQGLGSTLMRRAEEVARERGCHHAYLYTFSFQAPDFYRKLGFHEFARLEDFPPGHSRHWMRKELRV